MVRRLLTKENIIFFLVSSAITLLIQAVVFLKLDIDKISTIEFWQIIIISNLVGYAIPYIIKKIAISF